MKDKFNVLTGMQVKKYISILCILIIIAPLILMPKKVSAATDFTGYTPISTAEELRELAYSNYGDKYYLTNDIDLYSYGYWESFDFDGTLDGNGHKIDNLTSTTGGLFASLYPGATVRNLRLTNLNISVSGGSGGYGGIAGEILETYELGLVIRNNAITTIENCYVSGTLKVNSYDDSPYTYSDTFVGGILGNGPRYSWSDDNNEWVSVGNVKIEKCVSQMDIDVSKAQASNKLSNHTGNHDAYVGGILGGGYSDDIINNSFSSGNLSVESYKTDYSSVKQDNYLGGIVGEFYGKMTNCYSYVGLSWDNKTQGKNYSGSLAGSFGKNAVVLSCNYYNWYDVGTSESLYSGNYVSSESISNEASYKDWDFNSTWTIAKGINGGYPVLQWMEPYYKIATVSSSREAGTYINAFSVKLDNALSKAAIYYTTDGTTPTNNSKKYTGPIKITKNTTIKAIAVYGDFKNSDVVTYTYKVACAAPTANYKTGNRFSKSLNVKLATKEKGATIYYTTNGSTPTIKSKKYTKAIKITKNTTLKAIVVVNGKVKSNVSTFYYYRK